MNIPKPHKLLIQVGSVLIFRKYPYEDGGTPTDKILIVLHCDSSKDVFTTFTFTTSNIDGKKIPSIYQHHEFCSCELTVPIGIDFFFFKSGVVVGDKNFSFDSDCMVLFQNNIRERSMSFFEGFSIGNSTDTIEYKSTLSNVVLKNLVNCILKSIHITDDQETKLKETLNKL